MKTFLSAWFVGIIAVFAPIQISFLLLALMMLLDTLVKIYSIYKISKTEGRSFWDIFDSSILRKGYLQKGLGYYLFAIAILPLDYFFITPFTKVLLDYAIDYDFSPYINDALYTNGLLIIFCFIELGSINENWRIVTGNNLFSKVREILVNFKKLVFENINFLKNLKK